jgi:hypothetical protein
VAVVALLQQEKHIFKVTVSRDWIGQCIVAGCAGISPSIPLMLVACFLGTSLVLPPTRALHSVYASMQREQFFELKNEDAIKKI